MRSTSALPRATGSSSAAAASLARSTATYARSWYPRSLAMRHPLTHASTRVSSASLRSASSFGCAACQQFLDRGGQQAASFRDANRPSRLDVPGHQGAPAWQGPGAVHGGIGGGAGLEAPCAARHRQMVPTDLTVPRCGPPTSSVSETPQRRRERGDQGSAVKRPPAVLDHAQVLLGDPSEPGDLADRRLLALCSSRTRSPMGTPLVQALHLPSCLSNPG